MKKIALVMVLLATACGEKVHVKVNCMTKQTGVDCKIEQDKGKSEVEVCWDFSAECANGTLVKAPRTCGKVKDGGSTDVNIPMNQLTDVDKCDGNKPPVVKLTNLTLNGKPGE